jgi:hypothetical protein
VRGLPSSWTEEDEEEIEEVELGISAVRAGSFTVGSLDGDSVAILWCTAMCTAQ